MTAQLYQNPPRLTPSAASQLDSALAYLIGWRWPVFPVCSGTKRCAEHPAGKHKPDDVGKHPLVQWRPYQDRLPTLAEVREWWRRWPDANIGMATGALSGVVVLDLDSSAAVAEAERRGIEQGPWATTGRIGGRHLYFAHRADAPTVFTRSGGIDFRGQGGFVVLPPSLHRSGARYAWQVVPCGGDRLPTLPRWIDEMANSGHRSASAPSVVAPVIPQGERNSTLLSMGGTMRRRGFGQRAILAALLVENAERCRPPLAEPEVERIAASVARYQPGVHDTPSAPPVPGFDLGSRQRPASRPIGDARAR